jgi:pterin-4a-carbinolamine dehydratase
MSMTKVLPVVVPKRLSSSVILASVLCRHVNILKVSTGSSNCQRNIRPISQTVGCCSLIPHCLARNTDSIRKTPIFAMQQNKIQKPACVPCSSLDKSHFLTTDIITKYINDDFPLWKLMETKINDIPVQLIARSFDAKNFQCALDCINAMGAIAEEEQHHPNFHLVNYREVEIVLFTHTLNGVTENDFALAKRLDTEVKVVYSPKWLKEHPEAISTASEQ